MEEKILVQNAECPFRLSVSNAVQEENLFQSETEIVFLLSGDMTYCLGNRRYELAQNDFVFANTYEFHSVHRVSRDCRYVKLLIEEARVRYLFSTAHPMLFHWEESLNNRRKSLYSQIAASICSMVVDAINRPQGYMASIYRSGLDILTCLNNECRQAVRGKEERQRTDTLQQKACDIMDYLNTHYMDPISLQDLAGMVYLSPPYISKIFKDNFRIGFLEYLNRLRIQKSLQDLRSGRHIIDVAVASGFSNAKTYSRVFQNELGMSPSEYRKLHAVDGALEGTGETVKKEQAGNLLTLIEQARKVLNETGEVEQHPVMYDFTVPSDSTAERPWYKVLNVGMAALMLRKHMQDEILRARWELQIDSIRITGILSDIMQIYQEDVDGNATYFWGMLDETLDFLITNKLKPFLCLGYMPDKLAAERVPSPYLWNANTSRPESMSKWCEYLRAVLTHLVHRYSYQEVCSWNFEFWNSPQLEGVFWHDGTEAFQRFFLESYRVFRDVIPDGRFGSPGMVYLDGYRRTKDFLRWCKENRVRFDLFCLHLYDENNPNKSGTITNEIPAVKRECESTGKEFIIRGIRDFYETMKQVGYDAPIYVTEWNISPYFLDLIRDTCYISAYVADVINHLPPETASISYWALSDSTGEHQPNESPFIGELGMLTRTGLAKPSYLIFRLLAMMRGRVLESGENYMITESRHGWHVMMYNAASYSEEFMSGSRRLLSSRDRYQIFEEKKIQQFDLQLTLPEGQYRIEKHFLNRKDGSVYDAWAEMGGPGIVDNTTHWLLNHIAFPRIQVQYKTLAGNLLLSEQVPLHGIEMLSLIRLDGHGEGRGDGAFDTRSGTGHWGRS